MLHGQQNIKILYCCSFYSTVRISRHGASVCENEMAEESCRDVTRGTATESVSMFCEKWVIELLIPHPTRIPEFETKYKHLFSVSKTRNYVQVGLLCCPVLRGA